MTKTNDDAEKPARMTKKRASVSERSRGTSLPIGNGILRLAALAQMTTRLFVFFELRRV
jgi:hypothetical protein